jgi:hypothetical protein
MKKIIRMIVLFSCVLSTCSLEAQIILQKEVNGETIYCGMSGLFSTASDCGIESDFYRYIFIGTISSITNAEKDEKLLKLEVDELFAGEPSKFVTALTNQARCGPELRVGDKWLFSLYERDGQLIADVFANENAPVQSKAVRIKLFRKLKGLDNAGILRGTVISNSFHNNSEDIPLSNVQLTVTNLNDGQAFHTRSDAAGKYEFPVLPVGEYSFTGLTAKHQKLDNSKIIIKPGSCRKEILDSDTRSFIHGYVNDSHGKPIVDAKLALIYLKEDGSFDMFRTTETDKNGYYYFAVLSPGKYLLAMNPADAPEFEKTNEGNDNLEITPALLYYKNETERTKAQIMQVEADKYFENVNFIIP